MPAKAAGQPSLTVQTNCIRGQARSYTPIAPDTTGGARNSRAVRQQAGSYGPRDDAGDVSDVSPISWHHADRAFDARSTVGAGLLAKAAGQTHRRWMFELVRQQAGSYGFRSDAGSAFNPGRLPKGWVIHAPLRCVASPSALIIFCTPHNLPRFPTCTNAGNSRTRLKHLIHLFYLLNYLIRHPSLILETPPLVVRRPS